MWGGSWGYWCSGWGLWWPITASTNRCSTEEPAGQVGFSVASFGIRNSFEPSQERGTGCLGELRRAQCLTNSTPLTAIARVSTIRAATQFEKRGSSHKALTTIREKR